MRINEVGLSAAGNPGAQYVELRDPAMEPFLARLRFRTVRRAVAADVLTRVVLRLRRSRRAAVKKAIAEGTRVRARVKVQAEDSRGNRSATRRSIRLTN